MRASITLALFALVGIAASPAALAMPVGYVVIANFPIPFPTHSLTLYD